ncbi:MAG TPA: translation initiation factor IF-3 [Candidatus Hydrogenedens sp.]|nr:translation initiation factor IF-3 [Candidatus Hydrogenedens sp.]
MRVNEEIRAPQVRVIDDKGVQLGIMSKRDALREAEARELDLVEVAPNATPPVCRIMDFGKYRYEQKRRAREAKKKQHVIVLKEIKLRPKIDKHDFEYKLKHIREFLEEGNKVKVSVVFRGREYEHPEFAYEVLKNIIESTRDLCSETYSLDQCRPEDKALTITLSPGKSS